MQEAQPFGRSNTEMGTLGPFAKYILTPAVRIFIAIMTTTGGQDTSC